MKSFLVYLLVVLCVFTSNAQKNKYILSGPMLGHTELRTAKVWVEFKKGVTSASIFIKNKSGANNKRLVEKIALSGNEFNAAHFTLSALEPGTTYKYYISVNSQFIDSGEVTTQSLWQWRNPAPDFSFITGSCAYFNEPVYDRPGKPYGGDSTIFRTMAKEQTSFMLWLGDNWYARESDFYSGWGLHYRAQHDRSVAILQHLLKAMPQYAIWDDHDYGPNDADKSYSLKNSSREAFMKYWRNPSYGFNDQGIYTSFSWNDVDFFLLDDRWFRSNDKMKDSMDGKLNSEKKMFGDEQIAWLKNALLQSNGNPNTSFRVIVTGSQVLNPLSPNDCFRHFTAEYNDLMKFLADNKINGLVFITGDRHHSEIIRAERNNAYPLYDITVSPLTSGVHATRGQEANSPDRIGKEVDEQNYARISFSGAKENRRMLIEFIDITGKRISSWAVSLSDISFK
jgi:alkaline phosphatase D